MSFSHISYKQTHNVQYFSNKIKFETVPSLHLGDMHSYYRQISVRSSYNIQHFLEIESLCIFFFIKNLQEINLSFFSIYPVKHQTHHHVRSCDVNYIIAEQLNCWMCRQQLLSLYIGSWQNTGVQKADI